LYLSHALRKLTAIALIFLLFFNWYGYRLAIAMFETEIDAALQLRLEQQAYNENDLVELRIPINLPYYSDWNEFESFEGETTINGQHYRYVKRKLSGGELILLCLPNKPKDQLKKAGQEYAKQVGDFGAPQKKTGKERFTKIFTSDYTCLQEPARTSFQNMHKPIALRFAANLSSRDITPPAQPPDHL
jgi:hypothetical protein